MVRTEFVHILPTVVATRAGFLPEQDYLPRLFFFCFFFTFFFGVFEAELPPATACLLALRLALAAIWALVLAIAPPMTRLHHFGVTLSYIKPNSPTFVNNFPTFHTHS